MDISNLNSIATSGMPAAKTVASALAPRNATTQAAPKDSTSSTNGTSTNGSSSAASDSSDITANDFLTLLVSELKNQDPTQPTDPNQYITQLAQVNSLQQLISINQGIGTLDGALPSPSTSSTSNTGSGS
jgi:flagellar basal-body rod modification protein FlgD